MLTIVLIINAIISLLCILVAWRVCQLRWTLKRVADSILGAERATHRVLSGAPAAIANGQIGVSALRKNLKQLEPQLQRVQQVLGLLSLGQAAWQQKTQLTNNRSRRIP
ncbi:MAG: hypothetical protein KME35_22745 [Aphanocapsa sp. GSE-SYN-MK-11-07L]|jgi:hypothetical protein|nr:hypothetical protein [Aphanocapsa sp. GSE-SYN-MK-11-07L]